MANTLISFDYMPLLMMTTEKKSIRNEQYDKKYDKSVMEILL